MARLVTTRYVTPGVYIGQLIRPNPGNLTADARVCNYLGKGSRFAVGRNLALRRSFVYDEDLVMPKSPPYVATLQYHADGSKDEFEVAHTYNEQQIGWFKAGSALNGMK